MVDAGRVLARLEEGGLVGDGLEVEDDEVGPVALADSCGRRGRWGVLLLGGDQQVVTPQVLALR